MRPAFGAPPHAPPPAPAPPPQAAAPQHVVPLPLPHCPPWDGEAREELSALLSSVGCREHDACTALLQRLTACRWAAGQAPPTLVPFRDPSALALLLSPSLLASVTAGMGAAVLGALRRALESRLGDCETCRQAGLVARLLRLLRLAALEEGGRPLAPLLDPLVQLLAACLAHKSSPRDVAALLRLAQACGAAPAAPAPLEPPPAAASLPGFPSPPSASAPPPPPPPPQHLLSLLLRALAALAAAPPRPTAFVQLRGRAHAGLTLRLGSFPSSNSLSMLLVFRLEEGGEAAAVTFRPLFSLQPAGLLCALHPSSGVLLLRCGRSLVRTPPLQPFLARPGGWHSLQLVLQRSAILSDTADLYLDGRHAGRHNLPFPGGLAGAVAPSQQSPPGAASGEGPSMRLRLGVWDESLDGGVTPLPPGTPGLAPFQGALGCCALFAHACSAAEAAQLHLSSLAGGAFCPPAAALSDRASRAARGALGAPLPHRITERGHRKVLLALDPHASDGLGRAWGAATRLRGAARSEPPGPGVRCVLCTSPASALHQLGGPFLFLPLLLPTAPQHQQPLLAAPSTEEGSGSGSAAAAAAGAAALPLEVASSRLPQAGLPPSAFAAVLSILPPLLPASRCGEALGFVRALAPLLHVSPDPSSLLTPHLAASVMPLIRAMTQRADAEEVAALLLLDVPLWRRAGPEGRKAHAGALRALLSEALDDFSSAFGGEFLLLALCRDGGDSEERVGLLRLVMAACEDRDRPGVRAAVSRQLVRFVFRAASAAGGGGDGSGGGGGESSMVPPGVLLSCGQLLIALTAREKGTVDAAKGGPRIPQGAVPSTPPSSSAVSVPPRPSPPPPLAISTSPGGGAGGPQGDPAAAAAAAQTVLQLLQASGCLLGLAVARRLAAQTHPDVSSLGGQLRAALGLPPTDQPRPATPSSDSLSQQTPDGLWMRAEAEAASRLLTGSAPGAQSRARALNAQAWARRGGRAATAAALRALAAAPSCVWEVPGSSRPPPGFDLV